jgi:hypothetical protein
VIRVHLADGFGKGLVKIPDRLVGDIVLAVLVFAFKDIRGI